MSGNTGFILFKSHEAVRIEDTLKYYEKVITELTAERDALRREVEEIKGKEEFSIVSYGKTFGRASLQAESLASMLKTYSSLKQVKIIVRSTDQDDEIQALHQQLDRLKDKEKLCGVLDKFATAYAQYLEDSESGNAENYEEMRNRFITAITNSEEGG